MIGLLMLLNLQASSSDALKAFKNKDYVKAFNLYEKSAEWRYFVSKCTQLSLC